MTRPPNPGSISEAAHGPVGSPGANGRCVYLGWATCFVLAGLLFGLTANRGAQWQDSGNNILRVVTREPVNPLGLALSHPLHHWLGRFAVWLDWFEPCLAITLISSLAAAVAVANTFGCVYSLTRMRSGAAFAAMSLALAHTFWQMATLAEMYTLAAALLSGECWCLIVFARTRRPIYLWRALLLNGVGVSNHLLAVLTTPVLAVVVLIAARRKDMRFPGVLLAGAMWLIGSAPYTGMVLEEFVRSGDLTGALRSALFGHGYSDEVLSTSLSLRHLGVSIGFILLNFPNLLLPAAAYGLVAGGRLGVPTLVRRGLLAGLTIHAVFVLRYPIVDQHTFFLPMYVLLSIFGGIGLARFLDRASGLRRALTLTAACGLLGLTPCLYAVLPDVARHWKVLASVERHKPYRDDYVYLFTPWSIVERSAERMSREAVALAGADGIVIVEDRMAEFAVCYQALRADYDELQILNNLPAELAREALDAHRPVVLVPANTETPRTNPHMGTWRRIGDLYLLVGASKDPRTNSVPDVRAPGASPVTGPRACARGSDRKVALSRYAVRGTLPLIGSRRVMWIGSQKITFSGRDVSSFP